MAKNTLQDLRDHLFETLEALKDGEKPLEIERAKAICATAQTIIDTARVEIKYVEVTGGGDERAKKFFEEEKRPLTFTDGRKNPLAYVVVEFGEERRSQRIARAIIWSQLGAGNRLVRRFHLTNASGCGQPMKLRKL